MVILLPKLEKDFGGEHKTKSSFPRACLLMQDVSQRRDVALRCFVNESLSWFEKLNRPNEWTWRRGDSGAGTELFLKESRGRRGWRSRARYLVAICRVGHHDLSTMPNPANSC